MRYMYSHSKAPKFAEKHLYVQKIIQLLVNFQGFNGYMYMLFNIGPINTKTDYYYYTRIKLYVLFSTLLVLC